MSDSLEQLLKALDVASFRQLGSSVNEIVLRISHGVGQCSRDPTLQIDWEESTNTGRVCVRSWRVLGMRHQPICSCCSSVFSMLRSGLRFVQRTRLAFTHWWGLTPRSSTYTRALTSPSCLSPERPDVDMVKLRTGCVANDWTPSSRH